MCHLSTHGLPREDTSPDHSLEDMLVLSLLSLLSREELTGSPPLQGVSFQCQSAHGAGSAEHVLCVHVMYTM